MVGSEICSVLSKVAVVETDPNEVDRVPVCPAISLASIADAVTDFPEEL
jgi:hypothetical protein